MRIVLIVSALVALVPSPARADGASVVVATGGAFMPGRRPPLPMTEVVVPRGGSLFLVNAEYPGEQPTHNLWHDAEVALFWSEEIGTAQGAEVQGVPALEAGVYPFVCTIHRPNMTGILRVV